MAKKMITILSIYVVAFSIGSIGIPYYNVFPVNLFFWTIIGIILLQPVENDAVQTINSIDNCEEPYKTGI